MATENDYKQTVSDLTKLLNGGLLGEKSCTPIRTAIEALVAESLPALQCGYWRRLRRRLLREPALRALSCLWSEARL